MIDPKTLTQIKDPAHAIRVLEALVEQGADLYLWSSLEVYRSGMGEKLQTTLSLMICFPALIEGAKAVLARVPEQKVVAPEIWSKASEEGTLLAVIILDLAKAYAPRMLEAGMEVPA